MTKANTVHYTYARRYVLELSDGRSGSTTVHRLAHELAIYGQRITVPDDVKPGWWGIPEDIPPPVPLPDLDLHHRTGEYVWRFGTVTAGSPGGDAVDATLTVRYGVATITRHDQ